MDNAESHIVHWTRFPRTCKAKRTFLHGDETCFASHFSWCGHVARMTVIDSMRETSRLCMHKKHGVAAESEETGGFAMPRSTIQGLEVGAGSGAVCWHGMDTGWHRIGWCGAQN